MLLFAFALPALSQSKIDVSGKWKGSIEMTTPDGAKHNDPYEVELVQNGATCSDAPRSGQSIRDCVVNQRQLTYAMTVRSGAVFRFKLELIDATHLGGAAIVEWEGKPVDGVTTTVKLVRE
jgi:hypothetical protein